MVPGLANYRLDTIADHFSIPIADRHRAGSDALATAEIFIRLLSTFHDNGVRNLATARTFQLLPPPAEMTPLIPGLDSFDSFRTSFQKRAAHNESGKQDG